MLTGLNVLNYLDRYVGAAVLPLMLSAFALSDAQGGLLQSAFIIVYSLMSPIAGWLGDRRARMPLAAAGVLIWSVATLGTAAAPTFAVLLFARALIGVGEASYGVITPALVSDYYPAEKRARVLAIFYAAIPVGTALGYIVGGSVGSHWGWRAAFLVAGIPGAVLGLALLLLEEPPRGASDAADHHGGGRRNRRRRRARRNVARARRAPELPLQHRDPGALQLRHGRARDLDADLLRARPRPAARDRDDPLRAHPGARRIRRHPGRRHALRPAPASHSAPPPSPSRASACCSRCSLRCSRLLHPSPSVYWPAMFGTLFLLFLNTGPLNAALANVLPASAPRARLRHHHDGHASCSAKRRRRGSSASPRTTSVSPRRRWRRACCSALSGAVLLAGRGALERDLAAARSGASEPAPVST
jgi:hypothetical protein